MVLALNMEVVDIEILRQKFTEKNLEQVGLKKKNSKLLTKEHILKKIVYTGGGGCPSPTARPCGSKS